MTDQELVAIIVAQRAESLGSEDGDLSTQRAAAMNHYHGRPYGNEMEGRSQVVSRDLAEAVDWALPSIMRVFTQSGSVGEFDPVAPDDVQRAEQESDYTNQVIMKDNNGFMVLHDAFKDTLLLKNGYVKHLWETQEKVSEDSYTGLTMEQVIKTMQDLEAEGAEIEIVGQEAKQVTLDTPAGPVPVELFDIKLKTKRKKGKCVVLAVPTEEVRVSRRCRGSLQESPFTEHVTRKTRSSLIEMGMPQSFVYSLPSLDGDDENDVQTNARDSVTDESETTHSSTGDRSMDEVEFCEAYIRVDYDGDGIAELRKVVTVANKIPPGDEWNETIEAVPMTGFVAKRVPHRHVGESLDDEIADLQEIKTVLTRQLLDNIYLTNNQRTIVNENINLKDMMTSTPGGVVRSRGDGPVNGNVMPMIVAPILDKILPVVDYFDRTKENRTGITKASTGMDPDILRESTKGAFLENLNRASQKIEMITRMLAESGVKEMFLQVHGLLCRHQDIPRMVQMRGKWTEVNPQEWKERTDMTVKVGLGTGNEEDRRQKLMMIAQMQDRLGAQGMVGPEQAYALFEEMAKTLGFDTPEKYILAPDSPEFQQKMQERKNAPNPEVQKVMAQAQVTLQGKQAELQLQEQNDQRDAAREDAKAIREAELKREQMAFEDMKHQREMEFKRWEAELDASVRIQTAGMAASNMVNPAIMATTSNEINRGIQP